MLRTFSTTALRRTMTVCAVAALAASQACGSDSTTTPRNNDPRGTYTLRTIDGKTLPQVISRSPYFDPVATHFYNVLEVTVTDGGMELDELGDFDIWMEVSLVGDGVPLGQKRADLVGTYEIQSGQVVVTLNGQQGVLPIQNGQITTTADVLGKGANNTYVFRK
jgi:hypothetical protein